MLEKHFGFGFILTTIHYCRNFHSLVRFFGWLNDVESERTLDIAFSSTVLVWSKIWIQKQSQEREQLVSNGTFIEKLQYSPLNTKRESWKCLSGIIWRLPYLCWTQGDTEWCLHMCHACVTQPRALPGPHMTWHQSHDNLWCTVRWNTGHSKLYMALCHNIVLCS